MAGSLWRPGPTAVDQGGETIWTFADTSGVVRSVGSEANGAWKIAHRSFDSYGLQNKFPRRGNDDPAEFLGDTTEAALLEADVLMEMNEFLRADRPVPPDIADQFVAYFERIRNPEFKPDIATETDILRFELGILYCKYVATDEPFTWQRVTTEIAR